MQYQTHFTRGQPDDEAIASCSKCGEYWEQDDFVLKDDCFIDLKHTDSED